MSYSSLEGTTVWTEAEFSAVSSSPSRCHVLPTLSKEDTNKHSACGFTQLLPVYMGGTAWGQWLPGVTQESWVRTKQHFFIVVQYVILVEAVLLKYIWIVQ